MAWFGLVWFGLVWFEVRYYIVLYYILNATGDRSYFMCAIPQAMG